MPLSIIIGPGNEHDSKKLLELVGDLDWKPEQLYADAAYGYCQVGITSSPPALMMLCIAAIAVTNSSRLFNFFEFMLL